MKRIFITGAAGFIGFHLACYLKARGHFCLGLDHFNAYYDPLLKEARAEILREMGVEIVRADIRDKEKIENLLQEHGITHVVHLAAQAGVRHSLTHPDAYADSNLSGFISILEACKKLPVKFIYASSSSVYGRNKKVPFSVEDPVEDPANLYAATKRANELIARAYHNIYDLPVTGLRFFTVYGPWGRPDMAYYQFANRIVQEQPIQIFNYGKMRRDFTYIDDIVQGTAAAIDLGASCEIFNLGNNQPVELLYLVELLEKYLGKAAIKEFLPMQPGEVLETFADIEKSKKWLQFNPSVSIEEGMKRFVQWFEQQPAEKRSDLEPSYNTKSAF